jgi:protein-histidine pros-kinase
MAKVLDRQMFHGLLEGAPVAMIIVDTKGIMTLVNAQTELLFGYSSAALVGKPVEILMPERYRSRHPEHIQGFMSSPHTRPMGTGMDLWGRRRDGTEFQIEIALIPMSTGDTTVVTAVIQDITDRKLAEESRAKNVLLDLENQRIKEANKLKSRFLAHMSHELRTPLNAIIGFGEILHDGQVDPASPQHLEFLGDILTSARHLLQLINDILDLAKVEAGQIEFRPIHFQVSSVVNEVCGIVRITAEERRIHMEAEVAPDLDATLDPSRLKQVLYNYVSNALKFSPVGGRVVIRAFASGTHELRIEVEDNGKGISEQGMKSLFREFVQLEPHLGGTGLGLTLTRMLVEAQGGTVGATSTVGAGSVFYAVLPRHLPRGKEASANARNKETSHPQADLAPPPSHA